MQSLEDPKNPATGSRIGSVEHSRVSRQAALCRESREFHKVNALQTNILRHTCAFRASLSSQIQGKVYLSSIIA